MFVQFKPGGTFKARRAEKQMGGNQSDVGPSACNQAVLYSRHSFIRRTYGSRDYRDDRLPQTDAPFGNSRLKIGFRGEGSSIVTDVTILTDFAFP